ncbi:MAG: hypothetical protein CM15mV70_170 [Caudoviricetes sp.]|nr:MAG: hypothetical protein CM15mV70_170 [Caudoviricetes sp.]
MFAKNQVGRYEIFNDLTEKDVNKIKKLLGNKIAVKIKLRKQKHEKKRKNTSCSETYRGQKNLSRGD